MPKRSPLPAAVLLCALAACSAAPSATTASTTSTADELEANVAVLMFETNGVAINDVKVPSVLEVIEEHDGSLTDLAEVPRSWSGPAGIELRGTTSRNFPKQSYTFETRDESGDDANVALLGFPPESDWVLHGPYSDKTQIRNVLTYELGRRLDRYQPRTRYVELFINDSYEGIYVATERISRDEQRVDIDRANPLGDPAASGYIIRRESQPDEPQWRSSQPTDWYYHYPKDRDLSDAQRSYLHAEVDELEAILDSTEASTALNELAQHIDVDAWVDYVLIQELARNADAYKKSFYLVKESDQDGGLFAPGPVWDFNLAWGNLAFVDGAGSEGLVLPSFGPQFEFPDSYPEWWTNLVTNEAFAGSLRCRWNELRADVWSDGSIVGVIDDQVETLSPIRQRDDTRWQTIGTYVWPNPTVGETWFDEVNSLRTWAIDRAAWLDENLPGTCS